MANELNDAEIDRIAKLSDEELDAECREHVQATYPKCGPLEVPEGQEHYIHPVTDELMRIGHNSLVAGVMAFLSAKPKYIDRANGHCLEPLHRKDQFLEVPLTVSMIQGQARTNTDSLRRTYGLTHKTEAEHAAWFDAHYGTDAVIANINRMIAEGWARRLDETHVVYVQKKSLVVQ